MRRHSNSMEDYLEAIALLGKNSPAVRVSEISQALGVKMPSVTSALKKLSEKGLVEHERYGYVRLTPEGVKVAENVLHRHDTLRNFLMDVLGVEPELAQDDACKMEHAISPQTIERLARFVEFVSTCPSGEPEWLRSFQYFSEFGQHSEDCLSRCGCSG